VTNPWGRSPFLGGFGLAARISIVPKPFPAEFRRDVIAVAREGEAPIDRDFGI
jgi:hypothetical protein